jgi:membrane-bound ClpP family serine protease
VPGHMTALIVALAVVGASLLIAEAHVVSYGLLGLAGVAALTTAGVLAIDTLGGSVLLGVAVMLPAAAVAGWVLFLVARKALAVSGRRPRGGAEELIGRIGVVRHGDVFVDGELWRAHRSWADDDRLLPEGAHVVVERVHGLTLSVRRAEEWEMLP